MQAKAITIACSVLFVIADFTQAQDDINNSLYTKRYERLDIDTILASPRLVTNYVECLLNKKPCAPEGKALKRILPEALRTKCGRCHPSQKEIALKVITALYFDYPQYYKALRERWDPSGDYNKRFEEYLRDQKFNSIGGSESEAGEQAQGSSFSINITQRPTRQGQGSTQGQVVNNQTQGGLPQETKPSATTATDDKDLPAILNRFGSDDDDGYEYEAPKPSTQAPPLPVPAAQQPSKPQKTPSPQTQQPQKPQQQPAPPATSAPSRRPSVIIESDDQTSNANKRQVIERNRSPRLRSNNNGNNSPSSSGGSSKPSSKPTHNSAGGLNPTHNTWTHNNNHHGLSTTTTYYLQTQNPVLNIINRITMKFANTAEFIAGMLRGVVPQPQAPIHKDDILRKFCDRLRKTFLSHTNNNQNEKKYHQSFY